MSDWGNRIEESKRKLPLPVLMEQYGFRTTNGTKFAKCPFCDHKGSAGFFAGQGGGVLFKCFNTSCASGTQAEGGAWDEINFLEYQLKVNRKEASILLMKQAGLWREERLAPSVMPGKAARKARPPSSADFEDGTHGANGTNGNNHDLSVAASQPSQASPELPEANRKSSPGSANDSSPDHAGSSAHDHPASPAGSPPRPGSSGEATLLPVPGSLPTLAPKEPSESILDDKSSSWEGNRTSGGRTGSSGLSGQHASSAAPPGSSDEATLSAEGKELPASAGNARGGDALSADAGTPRSPGDGAHGVTRPTKEVADTVEKELASNIINLLGAHLNGTGANGTNGTNGNGRNGNGAPPKGSGVPPGSPAVEALRWFYARLVLEEEDREALWRKRGLTARTCEMAGFKSNIRKNEEILLEMVGIFPMAVLLEAGLFSSEGKPDSEPRPNAQFCGWGFIAKGEKGKDGKRKPDEWGQCNPVLIPYFDLNGDLIHLRPHKGGIKDKAPRFFIVRVARECRSAGLRKAKTDYSVVTEGEFKAWALWQALGEEVPIGALPGIQMGKPLFGDVEDWLEEVQAREVIVAFDNEQKSDPKLPGYKEEKFKRFDAQIWARFLAKQVTREGYEGKVCVLLNAWRDEKGKADWDGALAMLIKRFSGKKGGDTSPPAPLPGRGGEGGVGPGGHVPASGDGQPLLSNAIWEGVKGRVHEAFVDVLRAATVSSDLWQFFDSEEERIIQNALLRISYRAKVPIGRDEEAIIARRLHRYARKMRGDKRFEKQVGFLIFLAKRYQDLQGCYYKFKRLTDPKFELWTKLMGEIDESEVEHKRACEIVLEGIPERITNFFINWHYEIIRPDGKRDRLVTLESIDGRKTRMLELPADAFAQPTRFREWLLNAGGFSWETGERELQALHADSGRFLARKEVERVVVRGWHEASKLWFFADAAYTSDGTQLLPDEHGIFWHDNQGCSQGYKLGDADQEGQEFRQGTPRMRPGLEAADDEVKVLFQELSAAMFNTLGGHDGYITLGLMLAYGAGPEIFRQENGFPGLWLYGEKGQGKGTLARWLLRIWGFEKQTGTILGGSSQAGLGIALQQYGNLPAWLDEYQPNAAEWMQEKLKNVFDRGSVSKKTFDDKPRRIVGGALISGIATSPDMQLRSRYAHVQVSKRRRLKPCKEWFEKRAKDFFFLGRHILRKRKDYVHAVMVTLRAWLDSEGMKAVDERAAVLYGVAYSGFLGMVSLLESHDPGELRGYREQLMAACVEHEKETERRVDVNQVWVDLMAALDTKEFGHTSSDLARIFKVLPNKRPKLVIPEEQLETAKDDSTKVWKHWLLYVRADAMVNMLKEYNRRLGNPAQLHRDDLQANLKMQPYWVPGRKGEAHKQRFVGDKGTKSCWCIDLDYHPLGYKAVSSEEWEGSLRADGDPNGDRYLPREEWEDPRRMDLLTLVDTLLKRQKEENDPEGSQ